VYRRFLSLALVPLLLAAAPDWHKQALTAAAPSIDWANSEWERAIVTGDADVLSAPYAEDGIFIGPDGNEVRGRSAVRALYAKPRPNGVRVLKAKIRSDGRAAADPDDVYEWGSAIMSVEKDGKAKQTSGRYLTVWHRSGQHWLITHNIAF
jgi:ketosteroid isomerase-like protein